MTKLLNNGRLYYYVIFLAVHIGIVWLLPYVPTQDGPSHIYNLVILKDLLNGGKEWGDYFTAQLFAVPNLGFHLIAYPLLSVFPPLIVEKIFISCYMVLMGVSVPLLLHTFNRPVLPLAYFVFPVLFNFTLLMGFYSYAITVPLFILAFALGWEVRRRSIFCRFVCLNLSGFTLFYFHLIPFVFFLISLLAIIMAESAGYKRKLIELLTLTVVILPSLLNLFFYLAQGTQTPFPKISYLFSFSRFMQLMTDFAFFPTINYLPWQLFPASLLLFLIVLFGYVAVKDISRRLSQNRDVTSLEKTMIYLAAALIAVSLLMTDFAFFSTINYLPWQLFPTPLFMFLIFLFGFTALKDIFKRWSKTREVTSSEKTLIYLAVALIAIYLLAPSSFGGGAYFNQRLPWVIILIILPLLRIPDTGPFKRFSTIMIAGVVTISVAFNAVILWDQNIKIKKFLGGLNAGIPKGAFVMTYKPVAVQWSRVDVLLHAASYYGLFRGCVDVGNYEATSHYFPVRFKKTLPTFPSPYQTAYNPVSIDWAMYPSVQYLLGWNINNDEKKELVKFYRISWEDGPSSIWQRH